MKFLKWENNEKILKNLQSVQHSYLSTGTEYTIRDCKHKNIVITRARILKTKKYCKNDQ